MKHSLFTLGLFLLIGCSGGNNNEVEICDSGLDDDVDGLVDCADPDCSTDTFCPRVFDGFFGPESALFDPQTQAWYVSNIGVPGTKGDGFLSKLDIDGNPLEFHFITGLDDPKGFRLDGNLLYLADNTNILLIDVDAGVLLDTIAVPGAVFLNDVAIDPNTGDVYVSDTFANAIFRLIGGVSPELVLQDIALEAPNGILLEGDTLLIASVGPDLDPKTFTTSAPGRLFALDLLDTSLVALTDRFGGLDGLERDGQNLLTTDFFGKLFTVDAAGIPTLLLDGTDGTFAASADLGFDPERRLVAIPELFGTEVSFFDLDQL